MSSVRHGPEEPLGTASARRSMRRVAIPSYPLIGGSKSRRCRKPSARMIAEMNARPFRTEQACQGHSVVSKIEHCPRDVLAHFGYAEHILWIARVS